MNRRRTGRAAASKLAVLVVRPYDERVRARVFRILGRAGCDMEGATVVPPGTADEQALASIGARRFDVLLCPFHAHRAPDGHLLDGLSLIRGLHEQGLGPLRIVMPISAMGRAAFDLMLSRSDEALRAFVEANVFPIGEDALEDDALPARLAAFLGGTTR